MGVKCPECGHQRITANWACHTYGGVDPDGKERWWSCQGCDSSIEYSCDCWLYDEDENGHVVGAECPCMWSYNHYLNPNNPRYEHEQKSKPDWLGNPDYFAEPVKHSDVPWYWEAWA